MGRKIIFELADIKRHCVSSTTIGSTFVGNIKEKIPVNAIKAPNGPDLTNEAKDKKSNKKRSAPSKKSAKKKKRKVSTSSESENSDSDTEKQECINQKQPEISKERDEYDGGENGRSSSSDSETGSEESEEESSGSDC